MKRFIILGIALLMVPMIARAQTTQDDKITAPKETISRYPIPRVEDLPDDIKQSFLDVRKKKGFIPNVRFALAYRPEEYRPFMAYAKALLARDSGLTPAEKEMIIVATSNDNGCQYCVVAHGAALRVMTKDPASSERVAVNYREADLTPRQKAMLDFAMKVSTDSRSINKADFELLHAHGFSDEDIWDIASITAFFGMSNRLMNFAAVRPDDEFYMMGRNHKAMP